MNTIMELPYSDDIKNKLNYLVSLVLDSDIECKKIVLFGSYEIGRASCRERV